MAQNQVGKQRRLYFGTQKRNAGSEVALADLLEMRSDCLADPLPTPLQQVLQKEFWTELVRNLPNVEQRIMTMLRAGHSHPEIARAVGVSERTIGRFLEDSRG
jgi:DNA-binding NarL/FixJ family response regulator